jgi:hypothetical protein
MKRTTTTMQGRDAEEQVEKVELPAESPSLGEG